MMLSLGAAWNLGRRRGRGRVGFRPEFEPSSSAYVLRGLSAYPAEPGGLNEVCRRVGFWACAP